MTSSAAPPRMHFGRLVTLAMLLVVASFSVTLAVSHWRLHPIEALAQDIAAEAAPSATTAQLRSEEILQARRVATALATTLGTVSLLVAIVASVLVLRALRARDRLMREHGRVLTERAAELEAFAGRVAHDLKNPLGNMALLIPLFKRRCGDDPQLGADLDRLTRQTRNMNQIIDGLLAFACAGANPLAGASADLRKVVAEVTVEARFSAAAANAELEIAALPAVQLACTPAALTSVLSNLLGNAIKYIEGGSQLSRRISLRVAAHGAMTRVEVEDTGPGLPAGSEHVIFEPFRRLTQAQPGIGLGLATVKKLVEAYKGRVGVVSVHGVGSTFWFEIPTAPRNTPAALLPADRPHDDRSQQRLQRLSGKHAREDPVATQGMAGCGQHMHRDQSHEHI